MSRQSAAKKARRKKRQAVREARWIPDAVLDAVAGAADIELEDFDTRITQRGWTFDDEFSTDGLVSWFFAPSGAGVGDDRLEAVTRIWLTANDDDVYAVVAGSDELYQFAPDEIWEHLDALESHRAGDPLPIRGS